MHSAPNDTVPNSLWRYWVRSADGEHTLEVQQLEPALENARRYGPGSTIWDREKGGYVAGYEPSPRERRVRPVPNVDWEDSEEQAARIVALVVDGIGRAVGLRLDQVSALVGPTMVGLVAQELRKRDVQVIGEGARVLAERSAEQVVRQAKLPSTNAWYLASLAAQLLGGSHEGMGSAEAVKGALELLELAESQLAARG